MDRVEGNRIKLTKKDNPPGHEGHHHYIETKWVGAVGVKRWVIKGIHQRKNKVERRKVGIDNKNNLPAGHQYRNLSGRQKRQPPRNHRETLAHHQGPEGTGERADPRGHLTHGSPIVTLNPLFATKRVEKQVPDDNKSQHQNQSNGHVKSDGANPRGMIATVASGLPRGADVVRLHLRSRLLYLRSWLNLRGRLLRFWGF